MYETPPNGLIRYSVQPSHDSLDRFGICNVQWQQERGAGGIVPPHTRLGTHLYATSVTHIFVSIPEYNERNTNNLLYNVL
jgi:hypothetical protein